MYVYIYRHAHTHTHTHITAVGPQRLTPARMHHYNTGGVTFTRYCHCQYCVVYIAITGCWWNIILRNSVGDGKVGWGA